MRRVRKRWGEIRLLKTERYLTSGSGSCPGYIHCRRSLPQTKRRGWSYTTLPPTRAALPEQTLAQGATQSEEATFFLVNHSFSPEPVIGRQTRQSTTQTAHANSLDWRDGVVARRSAPECKPARTDAGRFETPRGWRPMALGCHALAQERNRRVANEQIWARTT